MKELISHLQMTMNLLLAIVIALASIYSYIGNPQVSIKVLNSSINWSIAVPLLALSSLFVTIYVNSLISTVCQRIENADIKDDDGISFVFFHYGPTGPVLGIIWLLSPSLMIILGLILAFLVRDTPEIPCPFIIITTLLIYFEIKTILKALKCRKLWIAKYSTNTES